MNKRADVGGTLMNNAIYIILLVIFAIGMIAFIYSKANSAGSYEDYYAKEIARAIDMAKPGDYFTIDVQALTEIAKDNKVALGVKELFSFDNENDEVCVKLSRTGKSCFYFFNNVDVTELWIDYAAPVDGGTKNLLHFKVAKAGEAQL
jgi:hypothetical protein